ncbi:MAG: VOC family protein [Cyanobacteria bacterium P01_H01_bin.15]
MSLIQRCLHTAILVSDLEVARKFYEDVLGLAPVERTLNFPGIWYEVGGYQIHLMTRVDPLPALVNPQKWGRNPHLAFQVSDLAQIEARLMASNAPIQKSSSGRRALFTRDPAGNILELSQL